MKKIFILLALLIITPANAQTNGQPYHPETAPGAKFINPIGHRLKWVNPDSVLYNIVYFSSDSIKVANLDTSTILYHGFPSTVYSVIYLNPVEPLDWEKMYYWRVREVYTNSIVDGPVWFFKTAEDVSCSIFGDPQFFDDFENGYDKWLITNNGGTCTWQIFSPPYPNFYQFPSGQSSGNVFAADADQCGSGTTTLTTATIKQKVGHLAYGSSIKFSNDFRVYNSNDSAFVEISYDSINWQKVWQANGVNIRSSVESIHVQPGRYYLRFRTIQPGWDWWWALDNVEIYLDCPLFFYGVIKNLRTTFSPDCNKIILNWERDTTSGFVGSVAIFRKIGFPLDSTNYIQIGLTPSPYITTYIDSTISLGQVYSYYVFRGLIMPTNEATVYTDYIIPVELVSFSASVNENNVTLSWITASETNNYGFEIYRRKYFNDSAWVRIGFAKGQGTSTEINNYFFEDKNLQSGKYEYQLKQIDFDGNFKFSEIITTEVEPPVKFALEQNYPNPFNPSTTIQYSIGSKQFVRLKVYDVLGNEIISLVNEEKPAGTYSLEFNALNFSSGIYYYKITAGNFSQTRKMICIK
ncbi:T9SS type A sorting domain-containing protein [Ignavibacterium album]|uniref:T9SS type A sorting domain-containing protein n=2 Tax=Ignavibacterium album TaxID=591197 RepID=UPI0026EFDD19|nr:T9SS type A sorting domain-containing protein [Ignavibacterium album]